MQRNRISGFQAIDGCIYFGMVKGMTSSHPNDINTIRYNKKLLLSSVDFFMDKNEERISQTLEIL